MIMTTYMGFLSMLLDQVGGKTVGCTNDCPYITFTIALSIDNPLQWRNYWRDSVSNHQPYDCLLKRLFRRRSKKTSKLRVTGLCAGNSPWTSEFPAQMARNAENISIWWRHDAGHTDIYWDYDMYKQLHHDFHWHVITHPCSTAIEV